MLRVLGLALLMLQTFSTAMKRQLRQLEIHRAESSSNEASSEERRIYNTYMTMARPPKSSPYIGRKKKDLEERIKKHEEQRYEEEGREGRRPTGI